MYPWSCRDPRSHLHAPKRPPNRDFDGQWEVRNFEKNIFWSRKIIFYLFSINHFGNTVRVSGSFVILFWDSAKGPPPLACGGGYPPSRVRETCHVVRTANHMTSFAVFFANHMTSFAVFFANHMTSFAVFFANHVTSFAVFFANHVTPLAMRRIRDVSQNVRSKLSCKW